VRGQGPVKYLGKNLTGRIYINSNDVTLDLMGFTITVSGFGITISSLEKVEIRNGAIRNFVYGIDAPWADPAERRLRISNTLVDNRL
jgi:hypothetical protein